MIISPHVRRGSSCPDDTPASLWRRVVWTPATSAATWENHVSPSILVATSDTSRGKLLAVPLTVFYTPRLFYLQEPILPPSWKGGMPGHEPPPGTPGNFATSIAPSKWRAFINPRHSRTAPPSADAMRACFARSAIRRILRRSARAAAAPFSTMLRCMALCCNVAALCQWCFF